VIQLFWLQQKVVQDTKYEIQKKFWIFLSEALATPRLKTNYSKAFISWRRLWLLCILW